MLRIYFIFDLQKDNPLFWRAQKEILHLNGEIPQASEDFIPLSEEERFEEELKSQSEENYCLYILFKIAHFIEAVYFTKILKMSADFSKDDQGLFWLINISRVQYKVLENHQRSEDIGIKYFVDCNLPNDNSKLYINLEEQIIHSERKESIDLLNNIMLEYYELLRKPGNEFVRAFYEDNISDETFAKIHPNAPFKLNELLKSKISFEDIRNFVINNIKQLQKAIPHPGVKGIKVLNKENNTRAIFQEAGIIGDGPSPVTRTKNIVQSKQSIRKNDMTSKTNSPMSRLKVLNNDFENFKNRRMMKTSDRFFIIKGTDEAIDREFPIARRPALSQDFNFKNIENEKEDQKIRTNIVFTKTRFSNGKKNVSEYLPS